MVAVVKGVCVYPNGTTTNAVPLAVNKDAIETLPAPVDVTETKAMVPANTSHYEKPPCQADEIQGSLQGADGALCAPKCDAQGSCPTDTPAGTWRATPQCILQDQSGGKYCALTCTLVGCPPGAKCAMVAVVKGVCVYPNGTTTNAVPLSVGSEANLII